VQPGLPFEQPDEPLRIHFVRMRRARRYVLRVRPDGDLRVTIPRGGSRSEALRFADQLLALAQRHGLTVNGVSIRNQRSRWGSCSARGHIALNFRLLLMPADVREYILVHELMHLRQPNHSIRFWRLVEAACPGFRAAERWLKQHGAGLF